MKSVSLELSRGRSGLSSLLAEAEGMPVHIDRSAQLRQSGGNIGAGMSDKSTALVINININIRSAPTDG